MKGLSGAVAVLGTRHGKGRVIVPILEGRLGLAIDVLDMLDTDRFGTFTREIPRAAGFRETARAKALAAIAAHGRTGQDTERLRQLGEAAPQSGSNS